MYYGSKQSVTWLDIHGLELLIPVVISGFIFISCLHYIKPNYIQFLFLHTTLLISFILSIPLISWGTCHLAQTQSFSILGIVFLLLNFVSFLMLD